MSDLPQVLRAVSARVAAARAEVALPGFALSILSGVTLVVVAGVVGDSGRRERAVLRARGASRAQLVGLGLADASLVALPSVLLGPTLATALVARLTGHSPGLPAAGTWLVAGVAAAGCVAVLAAPAARTSMYVEESAAEARPSPRSGLARGGLDIAVLAVAAVALWQLRQSAPGSVDLALVIAPALGVLAGALLTPRLVGWLARLVQRRTARTAALPAAVAAREVARRPHRYAGTVVLMATALAVAVLTVSYEWSWSRTAHEQAQARTGSDVRIMLAEGVQTAPPELADLGVAMAVNRSSARLGSESVEPLAVDAGADPGGDPAIVALADEPTDPQARDVVPLIATAAFAETTAATADSTLLLTLGDRSVKARVVERRGSLPTVDVRKAVAVADRALLQRAIDAAEVPGTDPDQPPPAAARLLAEELWLDADGDSSRAAAGARDLFPGAAVVDSFALEHAMRTDPLASSGRNAGWVALGAAAILAVTGFAGQVVIGGHRRIPELAVLRALGLRRRQAVRGYAGEQIALGATSALCGAACGALVSVIVLPVLLRSPLFGSPAS